MPKFFGKDHVHPFLSGLATLEILRDLGILKVDTEQEKAEFEKLSELINDSVQPIQNMGGTYAEIEPEELVCQEVHDHKHLYAIFKILWKGELSRQT